MTSLTIHDVRKSMNTTTTLRLLMTALALVSAATAQAQQAAPGRLFLGVNAGAQTQSSTRNNDFSFPIYGQTATVTTTTSVDSGPIFDLSAGYRFRPMLGVALGYSTFSSTGTAQGAASIPSPLFFNRPAAVTLDAVDAKRTNQNIYLVAVAFMPLTDKVELSVFVGPSVTHVKQELMSDFTVPVGTQQVVSTIQSQSGTATGVNVGADLAYTFLRNIGAGLFMRYTSGSVDLPALSGAKAGGFQIGVGARLRF
jgi:hypothetical protein